MQKGVDAGFKKGVLNQASYANAQAQIANQTTKLTGVQGRLLAAQNMQNEAKAGRDKYGNTAVKATAAAAVVFAKPMADAVEFESAMADVKKVVDFDTPQQFKEMGQDVMVLSQRIPLATEGLAAIVAAGGQSGIAKAELISFAESAAKMGVVFRSRCKLESFLQNAQGRVTGLTVRDGYRFPDEMSGQIRHYGARYGVVMCSGGFSNDLRFRKMQNPMLDERVDSTNHPGATSECLVQMLRIGATPVQLDLIQLGPWSSPDERGFGYVSQFNTISGFPNGIMVNPRSGHRFTNELADRKEREEGILAQVDEKGNPLYPICFTTLEGAKLAQSLGHALHYGVAWQFDSLEQLATHFGIPYDVLAEEVDAYNAAVARKGGDRMKKDVSRAVLLDKGPFVAVRVWPKVHYVMGGVQISMRTEVLNAADSKPIPGLYAAGEATAGSHGGSRLGSCAVADCLVFGRIAGASVAAASAADDVFDVEGI